MSVRKLLRVLVPAAVVAGTLVAAPASASATPLPCPTVDGEGWCYDVTALVTHRPGVSTLDATIGVTISVVGSCASGGCPWDLVCTGLGCVVLDVVFGPKTADVDRTGADADVPTTGTTTVTTVNVPRVCADDDPNAPCVGGFPVILERPTVSGQVATIWVLGSPTRVVL